MVIHYLTANSVHAVAIFDHSKPASLFFVSLTFPKSWLMDEGAVV